MTAPFSRTERLLGADNLRSLADKHVAVFGLGGVGGYVCEALVRSGIGHFDLIDHDRVDITNLNRQIIATCETIGRYKVDVMAERMRAINPDVQIQTHCCFYLPENADQFDFTAYDYVVDAVDTVSAKIDIITRAQACGIPVISAMGCGNKIDPTQLVVTDLYKTEMDPLAKVMRHELKKRGITRLKVVYSKEKPLAPLLTEEPADEMPSRKVTPASSAFVPSAAGLIIASQVVRDLIDFDPDHRH